MTLLVRTAKLWKIFDFKLHLYSPLITVIRITAGKLSSFIPISENSETKIVFMLEKTPNLHAKHL